MPSRRDLLATSGAVLAATTAGCLDDVDGSGAPSPGTDANADWPMPDYGPEASSYAPDAAAPRSNPSERFAVETSSPTDRPVIVDGTVYLPTMAGLLALDATDGKQRWQYSTDESGSEWFRSPAVHDGVVYVTGEPGLVALDANDGTERWRLATDEHVIAPVAPIREWDGLYVGDDAGTVYRVALDGTVEWRMQVFGGVTRLVADVFHGVVVGTAGGEVYRLHDGRGLWRKRVPGKVTALSLADGDGPYVATFGGGVLRLMDGAHAGRPRWHAEDGPGPERAFAVAGDGVFGSDMAGISRLDDRTGERDWRLDGDHGAAPAAAGDTVYVGGEGAVTAYKLGGGIGRGGSRIEPRRWTYDLDERKAASVAVADGALFVPVWGRKEGPTELVALE
ncbi:outer membrane protein assembly factor BamB family protein [Halorubellus salinus]|uniref:outer membrane protein assembly factor BamB family protein n=1 Tax=Halorubellus salinus TaxID=755309 RepID=UPI001D0684C6|nr:PQQ-binding-like beta-propeller repeat protein [Halorubellus salinus]